MVSAPNANLTFIFSGMEDGALGVEEINHKL